MVMVMVKGDGHSPSERRPQEDPLLSPERHVPHLNLPVPFAKDTRLLKVCTLISWGSR